MESELCQKPRHRLPALGWTPLHTFWATDSRLVHSSRPTSSRQTKKDAGGMMMNWRPSSMGSGSSIPWGQETRGTLPSWMNQNRTDHNPSQPDNLTYHRQRDLHFATSPALQARTGQVPTPTQRANNLVPPRPRKFLRGVIHRWNCQSQSLATPQAENATVVCQSADALGDWLASG